MVDIDVTVRNAIAVLTNSHLIMPEEVKRALEDSLRLIAQQNPDDQEIQERIGNYLEPPTTVKFYIEVEAQVPRNDVMNAADEMRKALAEILDSHTSEGVNAPMFDLLAELKAQDLAVISVMVGPTFTVKTDAS
jgi:hypothetical protein